MNEEEIKRLTGLIESAAEEMHKAVDRQDAEIKKYGETSSESEATFVKINERLDGLKTQLDEAQVKMERAALPGAAIPGAGDPTEAEKARKDAFYKWVRGGDQALAPEERKALVEDATGQYLVEPELDAEIVRTLPKITIIRPMVTTRTIGKDRIKMRSLGEVTTGWGKLETGADIPEADMTPGAPTYQYVEDLYGLAKIGEDELMDSDVNLEPILADSFSRAIGETEELAFIKGAGHDSNQPEGITINTTLIAATITGGTSGVVLVEEFLDIMYACPQQFRRNGQFVVNSATELALRKLRAGSGGAAAEELGPFLWQPSVQAGLPNTFLGKPIHCQDDMETLAGTEKVIAIFGDFKAGYRIIDRAGMTLQRLTELYAEAGLVGFKIHKRVGGSVMRASQKPLILLTEAA